MTEMRVTRNGFEIEYTQPLSDATVAKIAEARTRRTAWSSGGTCRRPPTAGRRSTSRPLSVTGATVSADRKKVTLTVDGLKPGRVVHLRSPAPVRATPRARSCGAPRPGTRSTRSRATGARRARLLRGRGGAARAAARTSPPSTAATPAPGSRRLHRTWARPRPSPPTSSARGTHPVSLRYSTAPTRSRAPRRCRCSSTGRRSSRGRWSPPATGRPGRRRRATCR